MPYKDKQKQQEWIRNKRQRFKQKAIKYLDSKCKLCGYNKCIQALEFHHINPEEKEFKPADMARYSWKKVQKELDKCVLLCANCHREVHNNGLLV